MESGMKGFPAPQATSNIGIPKIVAKSADEVLTSNTTLQNDDHLFIDVNPNEVWIVNFFLSQTQGGAAMGFKYAITVPSGATFEAAVQWTSATNSYGGRSNSSGTEFGNGGGSSNGGGQAMLSVRVVNGANAGRIQLQWAQDIAGTSSTIKAGSFLLAFRES